MLYRKYISMHLKSTMQYKANVIMLSISSCLISVGELMAIFLMFQNFESVGYWGFYETSLMFGLITAIYPFTECFARGFDEFSTIIKNGELDRILIRPVGIIYQIFGSKIEFSKLLKSTFGVAIIIISIVNLNIYWTVAKVLVLISSFVCGCLIIWGVMLRGAGISIFSVENLEFINVFTNGAKEISYYPINIYNKWLSRVFTFIIPVACYNYLPISYIMGYGDLPQVLYALSPILGMLFVIPCILFFKWSLNRYQSTGS